VELDAAAHGGELDRCGALRISDEPVGDAERKMVHRTGGRYSNIPIADAAGVILQGALRSTFQYFDGVARGDEAAEK